MTEPRRETYQPLPEYPPTEKANLPETILVWAALIIGSWVGVAILALIPALVVYGIAQGLGWVK